MPTFVSHFAKKNFVSQPRQNMYDEKSLICHEALALRRTIMQKSKLLVYLIIDQSWQNLARESYINVSVLYCSKTQRWGADYAGIITSFSKSFAELNLAI